MRSLPILVGVALSVSSCTVVLPGANIPSSINTPAMQAQPPSTPPPQAVPPQYRVGRWESVVVDRNRDWAKLGADQQRIIQQIGWPLRIDQYIADGGAIAHIFYYPGGVISFVNGQFYTYVLYDQ